MGDAESKGVAPVSEPMKWDPLPEKVNLLVVTFTYSGMVGGDVFAYCTGPVSKVRENPRLGKLDFAYSKGYPTDRVRNAALQEARRAGYHYLLMLDDDMKIDIEIGGPDPTTAPFLPVALDFALAHDGPCLVGAPYCSAPPEQQVLVMKNRVTWPDLPDGLGQRIDKYTRDEAAVLTGIHKVAALATGCLLIDTRVTDILPPPWFSYEFDDAPYNTRLASTEDIVFSRNLSWVHVPSYCTFSSWCGHVKTFVTGKPRLSPVDQIPDSIRKAWDKGWRPKAGV